VIAFEPDSLGTLECHKPSRRDDRLRLLHYGIDQLSALPNATIYIEAGASDWQGASTMAKKLRKVGIEKVRGFMLNATHYDWTRSNIEFGLELSRLVGGKHFVINTAENGRGPIHERAANGRRITVVLNLTSEPRELELPSLAKGRILAATNPERDGSVVSAHVSLTADEGLVLEVRE
jgi:endoglucanase